ncbi:MULTISPECIES: low molecular weight protein-tyrosine-phosphatase [Pontibacillus]|uniref:protein-tyrosine-phosphatase n=1 Tax=Pontibacillus chungwhensis TaxID=265426 RepID=A0ABY8UYN5_9BACI|nr:MULTISPECIES: low molecular weight protein-tyrosine-phosphatase [Pontibacillus]WIF98584.1 low molecular weight protein-tyrosine-phosphatase [Pontibacillus chungwhensis]
MKEEGDRLINVLFVCLGNICRSPMAEAVFRNLTEKEGLGGQFRIDSAGTGNWHEGKPPHLDTRRMLDLEGVSYEGMTARQVAISDWDEFDYIIAMDRQNYSDLESLRSFDEGVVVATFMDYVYDSDSKDVPDPYFTGNFEEVYELVQKGCENLLADIKEAYQL